MSDNITVNDTYAAYASDPTPANLSGVVKSLKPTIDYQLASLGSTTDPVMRNKALTYTAKAIKSFDPERSSLPTHVSSQLRRLSRDRRAILSPTRVPERVQLESYTLHTKEQQFIDTHGREPDIGELASYADMSVKKLQQLRSANMANSTEDTFGRHNYERRW